MGGDRGAPTSAGPLDTWAAGLSPFVPDPRQEKADCQPPTERGTGGIPRRRSSSPTSPPSTLSFYDHRICRVRGKPGKAKNCRRPRSPERRDSWYSPYHGTERMLGGKLVKSTRSVNFSSLPCAHVGFTVVANVPGLGEMLAGDTGGRVVCGTRGAQYYLCKFSISLKLSLKIGY